MGQAWTLEPVTLRLKSQLSAKLFYVSRTVRILSFIQHIDIECLTYYVPFTVQDTDDTVLNKRDKKALHACSVHYNLMGETDNNKANAKNLIVLIG